MNAKVKTVQIGYGHLGRWHAQKAEALETCDFVAIVEPFNADKAKEAHPNVKIFSSLEEVDVEFDAALIVTPTSLHFDLVKQLIAMDKHIFCEKPLCSTYEEAKQIGELLEGKDLVLQVGHSERCHKAWEHKDLLERYTAGGANLKINRLAPFKGRATDVDVVQDLMIHDIDLMLNAYQEVPVAVKAKGYKMRTDFWDYASANFEFASGKEATITVGRNHVVEVREFEVANDNGTLQVDLFRNLIHEADGKATEETGFVQTSEYEKRDHLLIEQEHFYNSIINKTEPMVDYKAGANAVKLVDLVLKAIDSGDKLSI